MIRLSKSSIGAEEVAAVSKVLQEEYLGMGKYVELFENELSKYLDNNVVCVSSGTAALHLALQALNICKGDEVIVQSLTYVASFQAISAVGATPIPCDINLDTFSIDTNDLQRKITKKTKAIMLVHYSGKATSLERVYEIADENNIRVVEDAAHAFGSTYNGRKIGSFGDVICFSFDGIKNITSGEGGCIASSDKKIIASIENLRLLGVENDTISRYKGTRSWHFDVKEQGWRYHMSNIMAAIGIEQLKKLEKFKARRRDIARKYINGLKGNSYIRKYTEISSGVMPHIFFIVLESGIDRDEIRNFLKKKSIETGVHYYPNHLLTLYNSNQILPTTEEVFDSLITLPLHVDLTNEEVEYVVHCLDQALSN